MTLRQAVLEPVLAAHQFLLRDTGSPKILLKIAKNLGDTLHGAPILKHYRRKYPTAAIAYLVCQNYHGVHEFNNDISSGGLFLLPNDITPQERLALWPVINGLTGIDLKIIPAINPFQTVYKQNAWAHSNIADQYFHNAGIPDCKPDGGRRFIINITGDDGIWAEIFFRTRRLDPKKCIIFEYNSYSHTVPWKATQWVELFKSMPDYKFIGIASASEPLIPGMTDARGTTWRRTVALLNLVPKMISVGSGNTMLACGAAIRPQIYELGIPDSVTAKACGYADSISIPSPTPASVRAVIG